MRPLSRSIVTLVALILPTFASPAYATEKSVAFSLAPGANSTPITPVANKPVLVIGAQTAVGDVGSGEVTLVNSVGNDNELVWNGFESDGGGLTTGFSPLAGTHIIYIDFGHCVDLEVASATSFVVHNGCASNKTGRVTLFY